MSFWRGCHVGPLAVPDSSRAASGTVSTTSEEVAQSRLDRSRAAATCLRGPLGLHSEPDRLLLLIAVGACAAGPLVENGFGEALVYSDSPTLGIAAMVMK
jgi:hypothetical protein